ncbi:inositol-3-phosphate synthase [Saccharopolyspora erythraea]|uniref:inositol-3-phosphate synthase n=1 Tax=Saccharopolyspora erythraea TaxID=1836 RepID=UPI001BA6D12F|nr:inositol-3-phosphate synthase [Saccharopolyspora erythraea]QUH03467.1 inositol-3-phosphate synthase [Saccharopolyspora erythraea]
MTDTSHRHVPSPGRTGLWLFGARGSVGTTAIAGLAALRAGVADATGCVTELPGLREAPLPAWGDIVVGGHDISDAPLHKNAEHLAEAGVLPGRLLGAVAPQLSDVESELRAGYDPLTHQGAAVLAAQRMSGEIVAFRRRNRLRRVVAVNVASTEAPAADSPEQHDLAALEERLHDERATLPAGVVNTYAALSAGCPYVEFTPSPGIGWASLRQLAERMGLPCAGCDGKTGETLLRSVLAPMFAERALSVLSWSGTNLLGGGDGATLADPAAAASKLESKARGLAELLGPGVAAPLHIDHVADLGQTKIAWDNVHARGFLGTPVTLQLTWTGYDSALAAPLVFDLTRLVAMAHHAGQRGPLGALGCFFKDPLGDAGHRFDHQVRQLHEWVRATAAELEGRDS